MEGKLADNPEAGRDDAGAYGAVRRTTDTAADRVTRGLREAILSLVHPPGALLEKAPIMEAYAVSRFPVAEAFNRLKAEGLVEIRPQSGTRVAPIRFADIREQMIIRRALEAETAAMAASERNDALVAWLEDNLASQHRAAMAGDRAAFFGFDLEFHDIITRASGFDRIGAAIDAARMVLDRARRLLDSTRRHDRTFREHVRVVTAIRERDTDGARRHMAAHVDAVLADLEDFARLRPEIFSGEASARRE